jgi:hypothetical protein
VIIFVRAALPSIILAIITVAEKYILVGQPVRKEGCYPHKRSIVSWDKAECKVTDLIQPLT